MCTMVQDPEEWCKMMDAYNFFCFNIAGFEIVRTSYCVDGILV